LRIIIGLPLLRASATSRIASPAVFPSPQSKADASKADDASPFALMLNEVVAPTATQQKSTRNKDGQTSDEDTGNDVASQAAPQAAAKPANPGKSEGNSADGQPAVAPRQANAQSHAPARPSGPQVSILMAAIAGGAAADNSAQAGASTDPTGTADVAANGRSDMQADPAANAPPGQPLAADHPQPDASQSASAEPASQLGQVPDNPLNIVQPNPLQPAPIQPALVQPESVEPVPDPKQATGSAQNGVQPDAAQPQAAPPKAPQTNASAAQNTVQPDADQSSAPQPTGSQVQTPAAQNTVQPKAAPLPQLRPAIPLVQPAAKPVKTDKSDGKSASNGRNKGDVNSTGDASAAADQPAGTQVQAPVQPDASLIATASASAAVATGADDDAGDDEPGVEAVGAAEVDANGPSKAQAGQTAQDAQASAQTAKDMVAAQTARQAGPPQASGQGAAPKTTGQTDGAKPQAPGQNQTAAQPDTTQQGTGLFAKPWQAKTQDGNAGATADSGQTNNTNSGNANSGNASPDDVKQAAAPAPQTITANDLSAARPPEAGNGNMQAMPGAAPQTQLGQSNAAPALTQNVQIAAPGANMPALAVEIAAKSQSGAKQFDIRLDPPELGRVEIRLSIDATGKASAHLSADQPQTLDLLQKDAPALTRALRDAGLNVSQNGLNFSLRQQPGDAGTNNNQSRGGNGRSFTLTATTSLDATSAGAAYRGPANGRLDIRV
jgi:flagellar hook-length control protein FliK